MTLRRNGILEAERGSTRWHALENSLWKRLWTCCNDRQKNQCSMCIRNLSRARTLESSTLLI